MADWIDLSPALGYGIYVLKLRGVAQYVGRGKVPLELIAAHRNSAERPSWMTFRHIRFDQVLLRPSHPDRATAEVAALISALDPIYNRPAKPLPFAQTSERRI